MSYLIHNEIISKSCEEAIILSDDRIVCSNREIVTIFNGREKKIIEAQGRLIVRKGGFIVYDNYGMKIYSSTGDLLGENEIYTNCLKVISYNAEKIIVYRSGFFGEVSVYLENGTWRKDVFKGSVYEVVLNGKILQVAYNNEHLSYDLENNNFVKFAMKTESDNSTISFGEREISIKENFIVTYNRRTKKTIKKRSGKFRGAEINKINEDMFVVANYSRGILLVFTSYHILLFESHLQRNGTKIIPVNKGIIFIDGDNILRKVTVHKVPLLPKRQSDVYFLFV